MRVLFALVAWGKDYVRDFLEVSLPTLMAEGNLADRSVVDGSRLLILTTPADVRAFEASPLFGKLKCTLQTEFIDIGKVHGGNKYLLASRCQMEALRRSEDFEVVIFLYPDTIWCRGGIRFALDRLVTGAQALLAPAPAVLPEPTLAALRAKANSTASVDEGAISLAPRELARIALHHHHPMWQAFDWDGDGFAEYPSCLRWNVPEQGWLIRCFHLHPVALRVQRDNPWFMADFASLDAEYVARLFDSTSDLAFAADTDHFAMLTLREPAMPPFPRPGQRASVAEVARWAEANAFLLHRAFANVAFRWHDTPIDEAVWHRVEQRSQTIMTEIRERLLTPDSTLRIEDPDAWQARRARAQVGYSRQSKVELPPSYARQPRAQLAAALLANLRYRTVMATKRLLGRGPLGRWLRRSPSAIALWQRAKRNTRPKSAMHAAASTSSLIRNILAPRR